MARRTDCTEPVLLRERLCQAADCRKTFFVCKSCDRGQRYCSPHCRAQTRRLQRRRASARYQKTPYGRAGHCDCQRIYRERLRSRSLCTSVTDQSSTFSDSKSSCGSDGDRPLPLSDVTSRPRLHTPHPRHMAPPGLRCVVCGCPGYLRNESLYEPDCPGKQP